MIMTSYLSLSFILFKDARLPGQDTFSVTYAIILSLLANHRWPLSSSSVVCMGMYYGLTLKVLNFWKFTCYCSLKPLWSGMGEVVPACTSPTLHPPSPPTVHQLLWLSLLELKIFTLSPLRITLYSLYSQITRSGTRSNIKWVAVLLIAKGHFDLPQGLCWYIRITIFNY